MADLAVRRALLRTALSLPAPVLRAVSGGGVVWRGGRTLDPGFQFLQRNWRRPGALTEVGVEEARAGWARMVETAGGAPCPGVRTETVMLDGPSGPLTTRLYRPETQDPGAPMLVFFHDGAGVVGDLETGHALCTHLADVGRCAVLAPACRLAPEHRFPAGFEDALAAFRWARENGWRYGAAEGTAAVGGLSMGGGWAAAICQETKRAGEAQPALQLMICPILDAAAEHQSMITYADAWPLSREALDWVLRQYLGPDADPADPRLSPFRADEVSGLAPAILVTAGFDPLVDQGELYARKLKAAGVPVVYRCYDRLAHAFPAFAGLVPCAEVACREIAGLLREGYEGRVRAAADVPDRQEGARSLVI